MVTRWISDGLVINRETLVKLVPGLTRDQVYYLLGRPHFAEGFRVREWDYVLHLAGSDKAVKRICQLKVLFDKDKKRKATTGCRPTAWTARLRLHQRPSSARLSADALFGPDSRSCAQALKVRR